MIPMDPFVIGSIVGAVGSLIGNVFNAASTGLTNAQDQRNLEKTWQRDDTAMQRNIADARAAGLSPLAGVGQAGNTSPLQMSAPQIDASGLGDALGNIGYQAGMSKTRKAQQQTAEEYARMAKIDRNEKALQHQFNLLTFQTRLQKARNEGLISAEEYKRLNLLNLGTHPDQAIQKESNSIASEANAIRATAEANAEAQREFERNKVTKESGSKFTVSYKTGAATVSYETYDKSGYSGVPVLPGSSIDKPPVFYTIAQKSAPSSYLELYNTSSDKEGSTDKLRFVGSWNLLPVYRSVYDQALWILSPSTDGTKVTKLTPESQSNVAFMDFDSWIKRNGWRAWDAYASEVRK